MNCRYEQIQKYDAQEPLACEIEGCTFLARRTVDEEQISYVATDENGAVVRGATYVVDAGQIMQAGVCKAMEDFWVR